MADIDDLVYAVNGINGVGGDFSKDLHDVVTAVERINGVGEHSKDLDDVVRVLEGIEHVLGEILAAITA